MSCLRADQLALFVEGGLSEPELREIDEHLIACAECAQTVVTLAAERSAHDTPTTEDDIAPPWVRPGTRFGRYVIVKFLGAGGMGAVYSAYDPALDRKVALKLIRQQLLSSGVEEARSRLLREAQVAARLSHVNVVSVHDVGVVGEQAFVAMELVEGGSLTRWLEKDRSWREICEVFLEAGRGLAAAHAAGVVHRDFKPDNVLVGAGGRIRVADFGLAASPASLHGERPTGGGTIDKGRFTLDGALLGTPLYMAPEQMEGKAADAKADQFGFCVALYEAWYRQGPFEGSTFETLLREKAAGHIRA
ncbi:MAG: protein kinase, partial [Deltaproteobacteria bacterium]|nr:protein kinase [Deltaproteobacteria bacterium]